MKMQYCAASCLKISGLHSGGIHPQVPESFTYSVSHANKESFVISSVVQWPHGYCTWLQIKQTGF